MPAPNVITFDELFERLKSIQTRHAEAENAAATSRALRVTELENDLTRRKIRRLAVQKVIDSARAAGLEPPPNAAFEIEQLNSEVSETQSELEEVCAAVSDPLPLLAANTWELKAFFSKAVPAPHKIIESEDLASGAAHLLSPLLSLVEEDDGAEYDTHLRRALGEEPPPYPGYVKGVRVGKTRLLTLSPGQRWCLPGRVPERLAWVQFDNARLPQASAPMAPSPALTECSALFDPASCQLFMFETTRRYWTNRMLYNSGAEREEQVRAEEEISVAQFVADIGQMVDAALARNDASGGLCLDGPAPEDPILRCAYDFAKARLIPESLTPFMQLAGQRSLEDCRAQIDPHLFAFKDAPWSSSQDGDLALLKHMLGTRSPVYAWNEPEDGLYGFRVRSSDHTWIRGEVYLAPEAIPAIRGTPDRVERIGMREDFKPDICRIGAAWIRVWQTK